MKHLFIIWSNARFCEKRITNDILSNYSVLSSNVIQWEKNEFIDNIKAFYGHKVLYPQAKIDHCGNNPFRLIIIEDSNPHLENRVTSAGIEIVNTHVFDKKTKYRNWTGKGNRIHCANTETEFLHDITVLFGVLYEEFIEKGSLSTKEKIHLKYDDTKPTNIKTFIRCMDRFGNNITMENNEEIVLYSKNKIDVLRYLRIKERTSAARINRVEMENISKPIIVFGEDEGELPAGFVDLFSKDESILINFPYHSLLDAIGESKNVINLPSEIHSFYNRHNLSTTLELSDSMFKYKPPNVFSKIYDHFKLYVYKELYKDK